MTLQKVVEPYKDSWMPLVIGMTLILFGGSLPLTIAAIEAFRLCGWDKSKGAILILWNQFKVGLIAGKSSKAR